MEKNTWCFLTNAAPLQVGCVRLFQVGFEEMQTLSAVVAKWNGFQWSTVPRCTHGHQGLVVGGLGAEWEDWKRDVFYDHFFDGYKFMGC
jgi:hypothetical protein